MSLFNQKLWPLELPNINIFNLCFHLRDCIIIYSNINFIKCFQIYHIQGLMDRFTGIYRQQTLICKERIILILQVRYLQHPTNPGCFYFQVTFQIFLSIIVKKYMQNTYSVLMHAQKFCVILLLLFSYQCSTVFNSCTIRKLSVHEKAYSISGNFEKVFLVVFFIDCCFYRFFRKINFPCYLVFLLDFFVLLQASYIKNLLQISKYLPNLRATILEIVIDQLIKIDVSKT